MAENKNKNDDDEFSLFRNEMSDAEPIKHDRLVHRKPPPPPTVRKPSAAELTHDTSDFSSLFAPETVGNEEYLEYRGDGIQNRQSSGQQHEIREVIAKNVSTQKKLVHG